MNNQIIKLCPCEIFPQEMTKSKAANNGVYKHSLISILKIVSTPTLGCKIFSFFVVNIVVKSSIRYMYIFICMNRYMNRKKICMNGKI